MGDCFCASCQRYKSQERWIVFTMDETIGKARTKREAVQMVLSRSVNSARARRLRAGAYEYRIAGETRVRTFYVMTEAEARRDGWEDAPCQ